MYLLYNSLTFCVYLSFWTWGKVMCFCSNVLGMRGLDRQGSLWHAQERATFHPLMGLWLWSRVTSGCKWWKGMKKVVKFWMLNIILNIYDLVASKIASGGDFTNNTTAAWHQPALVYPRSIVAQRGQHMFTHFILDSEPHRFMALNKTWIAMNLLQTRFKICLGNRTFSSNESCFWPGIKLSW